MKILLLADEAAPVLWEHLDKRKLEGVELVISCGDLPASYLSFLTCFTNAPILYVHGNHDKSYEKQPPEGCICIEDDIYVCKGYRILGLGGCMRYNMGPHQYTESQMRWRIRKLFFKLMRHHGIDILVTHAPALHLGDDTDLAHRGFACFVSLLERYHPVLMAHGHVHQNYRFDFKRVREYEGTRIVNAYSYYIINLPDRTSEKRTKNSEPE